jgi:hypothetical protein
VNFARQGGGLSNTECIVRDNNAAILIFFTRREDKELRLTWYQV